ncbi:MAG TPA: exo-beta-N-acetylmuramidase NamZ domain-containing protein [Thermoanaerobaculia bacterium]|nr:exo-beta-N-acetylmuramidase NamZ domain-containing protein [Thermoanaerobaculia bacterium]
MLLLLIGCATVPHSEDRAIESAIAAHRTPGGVLWVEKPGVVYHRAYGLRAIEPHEEAMSEDTIFDAASLTKVMATAPSIWILIERGKIQLDDPVQHYIPEFRYPGITIRHLLTHTSALSADVPLNYEWSGYDTALKLAIEDEPTNRPGFMFRYSDINFILLGDIVKRVSGEPLNVFAAKNIFQPLGMKDTSFRVIPSVVEGPGGRGGADTNAASRPGPSTTLGMTARIAPTEFGLRGTVHDPTARRMGGVAGHAGLFTTAKDAAIYARCLLNGGAPIMKPETVRGMTSRATIESAIGRTAGWDLDSGFSRPRRGGITSFGHTGWTGGMMWIDPPSHSFYIFLSNRVHPNGKGSVTQLQVELGGDAPPGARFPNVVNFIVGGANARNGIDTLIANRYDILRGHRVGLITNVSGVDGRGNPTVDILRSAPGVELVSVFTPEHGFGGDVHVPVYSLYDERRKPAREQLANVDTLVFDIQDVGTRFYTYISTMELAMEAAADAHVRFVVLDRVNPIGGAIVEGPMLEGKTDFVGIHDIAIRHGMTVGELAKMFNDEKHIGAELVVVPLANWKREWFLDDAGLAWVNPSPNIRSLRAAILYPGIGLLERAISVGRGTPAPFEVIGAPWIDGAQLARALQIPGLAFTPIRFTPDSDMFAKQECGGVKITITDRHALRAVAAGLTIADTLDRLYPGKLDRTKMQPLLRGNGALGPFLERRAKYLMY